ncbi:MAG: hypothetical protein RBU37_02240, partial [Myxococcota bacterium]|nr:hypothetical protein [Myxococcota bacterium]
IAVQVTTVPLPGLELDDNGNWNVDFQFDDPNLFATPLDGASTLLIRAANQRGVSREVTVVFKADAEGAVIEFITPAAGQLIGGIFTVKVKIEDPAGIDPNSVVASIAGDNRFILKQNSAGEFEGSYDGRNLNPQIVFPLLTVSCKDNVGNENSAGQIVALDTRRPIVDLDPPPMREYDPDEGECSELFDPLGPEAPNDGERIQQLSLIRVRVEDRANGEEASGNDFVVPMAGVNPTKVQLYVLDNSEGALIVDTDGDGICDEINPLLKPRPVPTSPDEAAVINLTRVEPEGKAFFPWIISGPAFGDSALTWIEDGWCHGGDDTSAPESVCNWSTRTTRIISDVVDDTGVVYAIPPVSDVNCMGIGFDVLGANISDGWACVAVRAEDNLGNASISPPHRLCIDAELSDGNNGCTCMDDDFAGVSPYPDFSPTAIDFGCRSVPSIPNCTGVYDAGSNTIIPGSSCQHPANFRSSHLTHRNMRRSN